MARLGLYLSLAFILGATLAPVIGGLEAGDFISCIVCGPRGSSDAIVNVLLFMPFGAALAGLGRVGSRSILAGCALSCAVELAQTMIPGRDPSLGDVTFNTLGTAAGQAIVWLAPRWLVPGSRAAARLSLLAALTALAVFAATARLLEPWSPAGSLRAWYTPDLPELEWYDGRVLRTTLGTDTIRPGRQVDRDAVRRLLLEGAPLQIVAVAGRRTRALAPLFVILDAEDREELLIGPDRNDLVLRYRSRTSRWRLDRPDLRLRQAFTSMHRGDTLQVAVRRKGNGYCLALNATVRCDVGYSIGSGWALLYYPRHFPVWAYALLEAGWVAGLAFPIGLWARRRSESALALALFGTGLVAAPLIGLIRTPAHQLVGAGLGLGLGRMLQVWRRAISLRTGTAPFETPPPEAS